MELVFLLLRQIVSMILMVLSGFALGRLKIVTGEQSRILSCVCIYLAVPCSLIISFSGKRDMERLEGLGLGLMAALLIHLLYLVINWSLSKGKHGLVREEQASIMYSNVGNLIMPMVQNVLGLEYVLYISPYMLVHSVLLWTHGQNLMDARQKTNWRKILKNPALIGIGIGMLIFATGIQLPLTLCMAMEGLSACMAPLSMLVTGIVMSEVNARGIFCCPRTYLVAALRLVFLPLLIMIALLGIKRLFHIYDVVNVLTVIFLCAIGPSASAITQQAQLFRNPRVEYVSSINVCTTIICAVTMPAMVAIFMMLV